MTFLGLLFLLLMHYLSGSGLISMFRIKIDGKKMITLSFITGVVILSFVPFVLQLFYIPITLGSVIAGILITTLIMNAARLRHIRAVSLPKFRFGLGIKIYEWPFMILFGIIMLSAVWRNFYFPPVARDMLSGPEVIAEYAVKEHTMINSVFTVNLETTNNHQKPPFITDLQIIYKLFGFPFGQIWLVVLSISFLVFLYQCVREKVHPVIACTLLLLFIAIPELFAYSYVILFDYSNMVLFFLGFYFLWKYFESGSKNEFYFSCLLFGFATYIRSETLILACMVLPAFWLYAYRAKKNITSVAVQSLVFVFISFFFYFIWVNIFLKYYLPGHFSLDKQINPNLADLSPIVDRFKKMNSVILFGPASVKLWGYYINLFLVLLAAELVFMRKLSRESRNWLYGVAVIYFGMPLLGYMLPLIDINNTTKRAFFKMYPLMLMVLANNALLQKLSRAITNWEFELKPQPKVQVKTAPVNKPKVKGKSKR